LEHNRRTNVNQIDAKAQHGSALYPNAITISCWHSVSRRREHQRDKVIIFF